MYIFYSCTASFSTWGNQNDFRAGVEKTMEAWPASQTLENVHHWWLHLSPQIQIFWQFVFDPDHWPDVCLVWRIGWRWYQEKIKGLENIILLTGCLSSLFKTSLAMLFPITHKMGVVVLNETKRWYDFRSHLLRMSSLLSPYIIPVVSGT